MKRTHRRANRLLLLLVVLAGMVAADLAYAPQYLHRQAEAQIGDDILRIISKAAPSTSRGLSRRAKGEIGEENIEAMVRALARDADELVRLDSFLRKEVLHSGIDAVYGGAKRRRLLAVEAKAVTEKGMLYEGTLGNPSYGREMSEKWIRHNLGDAAEKANRILLDDAADASQRQAARRFLDTLEAVSKRKMKRTDNTLVITRLVGLDGAPGVGRSIHPNLAQYFDNIYELDRRGRVLGVFAGTRR